MNVVALAAAASAALLFFVAFVLVGIAKAPGWERASRFALVAVTAGLYAVGDAVTIGSDFSLGTQLWASRLQFFLGCLHAAAWLHFAFVDKENPPPRVARVLMKASLLVAPLGLLPRVALESTGRQVRLDWMGAGYTHFALTPAGDLGGLLILAGITLALATVTRQGLDGGRVGFWGHAGFGVFLFCAALDFASAAGVIDLVPMASIGFVAALLPLALMLIRGFVRNARRLDRLSRDLGEAVRLRSREVMRVQRELADAQRHASIGRVAASVAHDINNPLAWLVLNTDLLREQVARQPVSAEAQESIEGIVEGAHRIKEAVEALRARTRWSPGMRVVVAPERLLRVALKAASEGLHRTHDITLDIGPTPLLTVDEGELMRILADLISCAGRVPTAQRGGIPLHVAATTDPEGWVQLSIHVERGRTGESLVPILSSVSAEQEATLADVSTAVERNGGELELREDASAWTITVRFPPAEEQVTSDGRAVGSLPVTVG